MLPINTQKSTIFTYISSTLTIEGGFLMKILLMGLGTIGEPLARLFLDMRLELGIEEVIVHKNTPNIQHRATLERICKMGARLAVYPDRLDEFKELMGPRGILPHYTYLEALDIADVVIHCTEAGIANKLKEDYYSCYHKKNKKLFIAQGSEDEFGQPYAYDINDDALKRWCNFIQIASCNTHQVLSTLKTLTLKNNKSNIEKARFYIGRRSNDISQIKSIIGVEVGIPNDEKYGSHQSRDAIKVLDTIGLGGIDIHTIADKFSNPFMHVVGFNITTNEKMTVEKIENLFRNNPMTAVTYRRSNNEVFNEGRSWGHYGRIFNQTIVCLPSLQVISEGHEIIGRCFTPQDGNVILSNVAATLWFKYPDEYLDIMQQYFHGRKFLFDEI